jgi:hypothetical protein
MMTIKGCNDYDEIVTGATVYHVLGFSLSCFLPDDLFRIARSLLTCSTDSKDNDVGTIHVHNQSACVLI